MSYILEALKKADRKRKVGEVPDLHTDHNLIREAEPQRTLWPYLLALLLFFNAGVILWWLEPWEKDLLQKESRVESSVQEETTVSLAPARVVDVQGEGEDVLESVESLADEKMVLGLIDQPNPELPVSNAAVGGIAGKQSDLPPDQEKKSSDQYPNTLKHELPEREKQPGFAQAVDERDETETLENVAEKEIKIEIFDITKIPFAYQLPTSMQQRLPEITISFHSYTFNPATRMVRINGRIMREGHNVNKEIKLEKIVSTGVVLVIDKRRFRIDV